jgi:hypothetical protein
MPSLLWPLPALLVWAAAWGVYSLAIYLGLGPVAALLLACALGVAGSLLAPNWWRRLIVAGGFPLSLAASGALTLAPTYWLLPLALLLLIYPLNAWRDAPLFPTPRNGLRGLGARAPLPAGARVLEAGCGVGDGLIALRDVYPAAEWHGLEWSWPLRWLCALRCPWARVRRGDIWRADWSGYQMVYLFQRPESMGKAVDKARAELAPGAWLVSLEFPALNLEPDAVLAGDRARAVWAYRAPFTPAASPDREPTEALLRPGWRQR